MIGTRVAKKYATALFDLARKGGREQAVWEELSALHTALSKDRRLLDLLVAPQIPDGDKVRLVKAVLQSAAQDIVRNFVLFLLDKRRIDHLMEIIGLYRHLLDASMGIVEAKITSAVPLSEPEVRAIIARLERISQKKVRHDLQVDPKILGGVVVILGGEIIDHSVRHDLSRLRDQLRSITVHQAA
ncbi:MAG: ATP synthase F1 subunit delta [Candidatus Zixiibacteriota bacterium]